MPTQITYRQSTTPTVPGATTAKGATLTTDEMDANFKTIADAIAALEAGSAASGFEQTFLLMGA